jgi:hypothetical protein
VTHITLATLRNSRHIVETVGHLASLYFAGRLLSFEAISNLSNYCVGTLSSEAVIFQLGGCFILCLDLQE